MHLIDRREAAKKGSAEWHAACEAIGKFIEAHPDAGHIAADYNSNLGIDVWAED
jgi:hypothetical protein